MLGFLVAGADSRLPAIAYEQQRTTGNALAVVAACQPSIRSWMPPSAELPIRIVRRHVSNIRAYRVRLGLKTR